MLKVALTGNLCSGKSTVTRMLQDLGAYTTDADTIVHNLLANNAAIIAAVTQQFGDDVKGAEGIDRAALAKKVFGHPETLKALEGILHPAVREEIDRQYQQQKQLGNADIFVAEIQLLFEGGTNTDFDATITVAADDAIRRQRYQKKHPQNNDYDQRVKRQMPQQEKIEKATFCIVNNTSQNALLEETRKLYQQLMAMRG